MAKKTPCPAIAHLMTCADALYFMTRISKVARGYQL